MRVDAGVVVLLEIRFAFMNGMMLLCVVLAWFFINGAIFAWWQWKANISLYCI